jgi:hypothetical protein
MQPRAVRFLATWVAGTTLAVGLGVLLTGGLLVYAIVAIPPLGLLAAGGLIGAGQLPAVRSISPEPREWLFASAVGTLGGIAVFLPLREALHFAGLSSWIWLFVAVGGALGLVQWLVVARRNKAAGSLWRGVTYVATSCLAVVLSARVGGLMPADLRPDLLSWPVYLVVLAGACAAAGLVYAVMTGVAMVVLLSSREGN